MIVTLGVTPVLGESPQSQLAACRIYMNYFTGKRLGIALQMSIDRHSKVFGPIATNSNPVNSLQSAALRPVYANLVRITGSPEELLIDFGINPNPTNARLGPSCAVHTQVAMLYPTAKQLSDDISQLISDHERKHGNIELAVQKRLV